MKPRSLPALFGHTRDAADMAALRELMDSHGPRLVAEFGSAVLTVENGNLDVLSLSDRVAKVLLRLGDADREALVEALAGCVSHGRSSASGPLPSEVH